MILMYWPSKEKNITTLSVIKVNFKDPAFYILFLELFAISSINMLRNCQIQSVFKKDLIVVYILSKNK